MILNKNICYEIWYQYLRFLPDEKKVIFPKSFEGSYYKKGEYIHYKIKGIFIPDNNIANKPKFITDDDKIMSIDKVGILEYITKYFFPRIECEEVQKLKSTIVYLRRVYSDLDWCDNRYLNNEYAEFLRNTQNRICDEIDSCHKLILEFAQRSMPLHPPYEINKV
jgi:hypothetical protein